MHTLRFGLHIHTFMYIIVLNVSSNDMHAYICTYYVRTTCLEPIVYRINFS